MNLEEQSQLEQSYVHFRDLAYLQKEEITRLRSDVERLNQMIRETGQGQGAIDAYAAQCEEVERLRGLLTSVGTCEGCRGNPMIPECQPWCKEAKRIRSERSSGRE